MLRILLMMYRKSLKKILKGMLLEVLGKSFTKKYSMSDKHSVFTHSPKENRIFFLRQQPEYNLSIPFKTGTLLSHNRKTTFKVLLLIDFHLTQTTIKLQSEPRILITQEQTFFRNITSPDELRTPALHIFDTVAGKH